MYIYVYIYMYIYILTIYKNKVSISCYSEFHAITGNHQTTKELLTVAYCLLTSRRLLACAGRIRAVKFFREKPSSVDATREKFTSFVQD